MQSQAILDQLFPFGPITISTTGAHDASPQLLYAGITRAHLLKAISFFTGDKAVYEDAQSQVLVGLRELAMRQEFNGFHDGGRNGTESVRLPRRALVRPNYGGPNTLPDGHPLWQFSSLHATIRAVFDYAEPRVTNEMFEWLPSRFEPSSGKARPLKHGPIIDAQLCLREYRDWVVVDMMLGSGYIPPVQWNNATWQVMAEGYSLLNHNGFSRNRYTHMAHTERLLGGEAWLSNGGFKSKQVTQRDVPVLDTVESFGAAIRLEGIEVVLDALKARFDDNWNSPNGVRPAAPSRLVFEWGKMSVVPPEEERPRFAIEEGSFSEIKKRVERQIIPTLEMCAERAVEMNGPAIRTIAG